MVIDEASMLGNHGVNRGDEYRAGVVVGQRRRLRQERVGAESFVVMVMVMVMVTMPASPVVMMAVAMVAVVVASRFRERAGVHVRTEVVSGGLTTGVAVAEARRRRLR